MANRKIANQAENKGHSLVEQVENELQKAEGLLSSGQVETCYSLCGWIERSISTCIKYGLPYENISESAQRLANLKRRMNVLMINSVRNRASSIKDDEMNKQIRTKN